ncbi:putative membrane protein YeaQ/YmgE (transglycosylase-associated protein family) [Sphingobium sp. OAS761]|uniref:GlsB/YeaQ/YmgE family stress response membrane protein n=1 Tax=Sphingobium sp. OAS761 TaxID=2817901 RepID=UPI00209D8518|nr:GlsB/YeaQ/YmgE family stress response membrane protein [Sphingobium sp. OAS761]MCP1469981.1 putative membrane protein YeaQ/YmgE (transglycosylase-associated protein family) [Sphingobium sp. OAS761]
MDLLGWIAIGLLAGALAKLIMPGRDPGGCVVTILLGMAGALLAGFLGRLGGFYAPGERAGFIAATLGAVAILMAYRSLAGRR